MVAVQARGRDQHGQPLEQFQRRQPQSRAAIGLGLGEAIDELVVTDLLEALQREGRARTCCCTAARSSGVSAAASAKWTCPSSPALNTPSITQQWKWTWAFNALPKRCYTSSPPPAARARSRCADAAALR